MRKFTKYILIISLALFFTACEPRPFLYQVKNNQVLLYEPSGKSILQTLDLKASNPVYFNDSCTKFSHTIDLMDKNYGDLYIDSIVLTNQCKFTGQERGMFEYFLQFRSKLKTLKLLQREEINHYEFSKYLIDGQYMVNLIYIYEGDRATFILDYSGKLSNQLMKKLHMDKEFELNTTVKNINPPFSMVRDNPTQEFWNKK